MKTYGEIIKALETCRTLDARECEECPYKGRVCVEELPRDAANAIKTLCRELNERRYVIFTDGFKEGYSAGYMAGINAQVKRDGKL